MRCCVKPEHSPVRNPCWLRRFRQLNHVGRRAIRISIRGNPRRKRTAALRRGACQRQCCPRLSADIRTRKGDLVVSPTNIHDGQTGGSIQPNAARRGDIGTSLRQDQVTTHHHVISERLRPANRLGPRIVDHRCIRRRPGYLSYRVVPAARRNNAPYARRPS